MEEYLVIARKYRPQQFNEIIGQEHVCTTLVNAIKGNRLAHAYLFSGPKGIGKTTIARIFAKSLNCSNGPTVTPCDKCAPCLEITKGNSMDVLEIDGASNRGIDEVRELRENVKFAASGGRFKIYIIDEVHMLTNEAFNALLKTLEEPPAHVKFFFATTEPNEVPATILSRCQRFELRRLSAGFIVNRLSGIALKEKIKIGQNTLYTIARYANGSMRDAESTLDKLIAYGGNEINHNEALTILGIVDKDILFDLSHAIMESDINKALSVTTSIFEQGKDLEQFLLDALNHFRNILLAKYSPEIQKLIELPEDDVKKIIEISGNFSQSRLLEIIDTLTQMQGELKWSLSKRISLEMGVIRLARTAAKINPDELVERLEEMEKRLNTGGNPTAPSNKKEDKNTPAVETKQPEQAVHPQSAGQAQLFGQIKGLWQEILANIGKKNPLLKSYLSEGSLMELNNSTLTIGFDPACTLHQESLSKENNKEIIEKKLEERLGTRIKLAFKISESLSKPKASQKQIIDSPSVEKIRQKFGAKIISVKS